MESYKTRTLHLAQVSIIFKVIQNQEAKKAKARLTLD